MTSIEELADSHAAYKLSACNILTKETVCVLGLFVHFVPYDVKMKPLESYCEAEANILQAHMNHWMLWL